MGKAKPAPMNKAAVIAAADGLRRFRKDISVRAGLSDAHAGIVAEVLVWGYGMLRHESHCKPPRTRHLAEEGWFPDGGKSLGRVLRRAFLEEQAREGGGPAALEMGAAVR